MEESPAMAIRGILFDLGGTILHYTLPAKAWKDSETLGSRAVYRLLQKLHYPLPPEEEALEKAWEFSQYFWTILDTIDVKNLKLDYYLSLMIKQQWGVNTLTSAVVGQLSQAHMAAVRPHVRPLAGAEDTLRGLRERGFKMGLISNTLWPGKAHQEDLERYGLLAYFEHQIFSSDAEIWKPHREVFQREMGALGLKPEEAVFVGDSLYFDVWGAQQAGMRGVWIGREGTWLPDGVQVTPDAAISQLPDLCDVIDGWQ
jgi:HAD superfamily hydrolase (TIGR01509 family)